MTELTCAEVVDRVDLALDDDLSAEADAHVEACLRCQAALAHARRLRRECGRLATTTVAVPAELAEAILAGLNDPAGPLARRAAATRRRIAYVAGAVAATAGAVAGAVVAVNRARRVVPVG